MIYIENDRGEHVIAVGAPGSIARAKIQYPTLIEQIDDLYSHGAERSEAETLILDKGIRSKLETESILANTMFKDTI